MVAERGVGGEGLIHILAQVIKYLTVATMKAATKVRAAGERKPKTSADRCTESLIYAIIGNLVALEPSGHGTARGRVFVILITMHCLAMGKQKTCSRASSQ